MISTTFNGLISGTLNSYWTHFWLLAGAFILEIIVGVGIALEANWPMSRRQIIATGLVIGGIILGIMFTLGLFIFDEAISSTQQQKIIALETELAPRNWTKEQFDALQTLKGKLPGVGIAWERYCTECMQYAELIQIALHEAGAQIYQDPSYDPGALSSDTGIELILPVTADLSSDPIVAAFKAAGLNPMTRHHVVEFSTIKTDIPVVVVGERYRRYIRFPYYPNYPNGVGSPYPLLPLKIR